MSISKIVGWVISSLLFVLLVFLSGMSKLTEWEGKAEEFAKSGFTVDTMYKIGFVEITIAVLYMIPRTAFLGAVLLTGYLGGAVATHVRMQDGNNFIMPIVIGVLVWIALGLRQPDVFRIALGLQRKELQQ